VKGTSNLLVDFPDVSGKEVSMIGHTELLIIVLVVLVLFGAAAIPKFARSLGQAKKEFTTAMKEGEEEDKKALENKGEKQA
jgi:sec-independent protein translocase protein TatA